MIGRNVFRILLIVSTALCGIGGINTTTSTNATSYYDDPDVSTAVGHEFTAIFSIENNIRFSYAKKKQI